MWSTYNFCCKSEKNKQQSLAACKLQIHYQKRLFCHVVWSHFYRITSVFEPHAHTEHSAQYVLYIFALQHILCVSMTVWRIEKTYDHMLCAQACLYFFWNETVSIWSKQNLYVVFCPYVHLNCTAPQRVT